MCLGIRHVFVEKFIFEISSGIFYINTNDI